MDASEIKKIAKLLDFEKKFKKNAPIAILSENEKVITRVENVENEVSTIKDDSQKIVEAINTLDQDKASKKELENAIASVEMRKGDRGFKGEKGDTGERGEKGEKGDTVIVDKIIEKTEVIKEIPIVTENVVERTTEEIAGEEIVNRINELPQESDKMIDASHIKNLPKFDSKLVGGTIGIKEIVAGTGISVDNSNISYPIISAPGSTTDEKVKYDASDPTAGYVADKFVAGTGITLSEGTGADENKLKITNSLDISGKLNTDQTTQQTTTGTFLFPAVTFGDNVDGVNATANDEILTLTDKKARAIAYVSATTPERNVASNPDTESYEVLAGSNLLVVVINSAHTNELLDMCPSSVTYNGVAMTLASPAQIVATTQVGCVSTWYLFNPPVGTYNVVTTYTNTPDAAGAKAWFYQFSGVKEEAPIVAGTTNPTAQSTVSTDITTIADNSLIIATAGTAGGSTTGSWTQNNGTKLDSSFSPRCTTGYWIATGVAGVKNITNTFNGSITMCQQLVAFKPLDNNNLIFDLSQTDNVDVSSDSLKGIDFKNFNFYLASPTKQNNYLGVIFKNDKSWLHNFNYGDNGTVTTAGNNIFLGEEAGNLTTGSIATNASYSSYNIGIGTRTLYSVTNGYNNAGLGYNALRQLTTGIYNSAFGTNSMRDLITGENNTGVGAGSLFANLDGDYNTAIGYNAGRYYGAGTDGLTIASKGVFIGYLTKSSANSSTNEIVIGSETTGLGNNTIVIGNTSITDAYLRGNNHILSDTWKQYYGAGDDASIYYDGTNLILNPKVVGTGYFNIQGQTLLDDKLMFTQTDGNEFIDSLNDGYMDYGATTAHRFNAPVRSTTASYRRYYHLETSAFDPGLSGATWTTATANNTSGWQLNASTETLEFDTDVHSDWDGASDLMVEVIFALLSAGSANDTVDLRLQCFYNGVGDIATKTQIVEVPTTTDGTQYKVYKAMFTIDYDAVSNEVEAGDRISFILNLETDTSEIDNVLINHCTFYYNTTHIGIESGDL